MGAETKNCQNCKANFTVEPADFDFYKKIGVSAPTWCPECRNQRRMSWRNERSLYKRPCDAPGHTENIISMYDPHQPYKAYDAKYWWSDAWDPLSYGVDYDFNKPFFTQFSELFKRVPLIALSNINSTNSDYTNFVAMNKNCYLCFGAGLNENVSYSNKALESKDSQDLMMVTRAELSYDCTNCLDIYKLLFSDNCKNCTNSAFLYGCRDCTNCFLCTNLVSKSYCILNKQYTKEQYAEKLKEFDVTSRSGIAKIQDEFKKLQLASIRKYSNIISSVNATGDNISNAKNAYNCFDLFEDVEDAKYLYSALQLKESYDGNGIYRTQFGYEMVDSNESNGSVGTITTYNSNNARYSFNCHSCSSIFGCTGLRSKSYCILNKQYSKEEYNQLLPKIVAQMTEVPYVDAKGRKYVFGDFFPTEIAPFAYNETIAQEYMPLTKSGVATVGYRWHEPERKEYTATKKASDLRDKSSEITDAIVSEVIECAHKGECNEQCTTAFKFTPQEINLYKRLQLPLPQLCSNCRHFARLTLRNPLKLWSDSCQCAGTQSTNGIYKNTITHPHGATQCPVKFQTPYPPKHPQILYCEQCYQTEVI